MSEQRQRYKACGANGGCQCGMIWDTHRDICIAATVGAEDEGYTSGEGVTREEKIENARKIAALLNAFAGIDDPAAFMAEVREVLESAPALFQYGIDYESECAEDDEWDEAMSDALAIRERIDALLAQLPGDC